MAGAAPHQLASSDDLGLEPVSTLQTNPRIMAYPSTARSDEQRTRALTTSVQLPDQETSWSIDSLSSVHIIYFSLISVSAPPTLTPACYTHAQSCILFTHYPVFYLTLLHTCFLLVPDDDVRMDVETLE